MVKIYKQPFAHGGDTIAIPSASQPDGKMSSADGWTPDYQLPKTDPNYKPVGRQEMNGVFKEVTESLGQVQVQGSATWSADGAPYPVNAQVYHGGKQWLALRANSVAPAEGADWAAIGTAATANLTTSNTDGTAGRVLTVGNGGWMGQGVAIATPLGYPASIADATNQTKVIRSDDFDNDIYPFSSGIHFSASDTWGRLRVGGFESIAWIQGGASSGGVGWTSQVVLSVNLLQATGSSAALPMSQKAVTDALGVFGQPSMSGSATLNGTTDNAVQLTDIVTTLGLEVGDVIRIQYSGYNKLHTVESITNNNLIVVNYEHAGNRGNGSLKLADTTASVTVTRIAKWYNAPIGLGQAWLTVTSSIANNTNRVNTTGRQIEVIFSGGKIGAPSSQLFVDEIEVAEWGGTEGDELSATFTLNSGGVYKIVNLPQDSFYVTELR